MNPLFIARNSLWAILFSACFIAGCALSVAPTNSESRQVFAGTDRLSGARFGD